MNAVERIENYIHERKLSLKCELVPQILFYFGFCAGKGNHYSKKIAAYKLSDLREIAEEYAEKYVDLGKDKDVGDYVDEMVQHDKRFDPICRVTCECAACRRQFDACYHADGTYDYVTAPCECEATFQPVAGAPSISEWLATLF